MTVWTKAPITLQNITKSIIRGKHPGLSLSQLGSISTIKQTMKLSLHTRAYLVDFIVINVPLDSRAADDDYFFTVR